ncbi:amidase [Shinella zoogloeoides]|uniref:amidase n=1 Tax=Shinella zoogloeoides TaxID=352475 RepID=UPI00299E445E|nr:amidase [Shinella zoogloeoides]WPE23878.1 2-amino-5-chloromuconic acid deaminase [Shinella zoogloeoides]
MRATLNDLARDLAAGKVTAAQLIEESLARIAEPAGEGARAFVKVHAEKARVAAKAADELRRAGLAPSRFAGIPIAVKDLFDLAGEPTPAGSTVLADAAPATSDAPAIARLKAAGFIVVGRNNMTEFAFSGVGINPHYGTPANPYDRATGRIPGGSSSGAAVSVADGMAAAAIGSDTGGSCRIPAALCGIVGYKPTASTVPLAGALPLSFTLDSIGPLANSVDCCASLHEILSGTSLDQESQCGVAGLRIAVPQSVVFDGIEPHVARTFEAALKRLAEAGAVVSEIALKEFEMVGQINARGGFPAPEALAWHRDLLEEHGEAYDQRVRARILRAREQTAADYIDMLHLRRAYIEATNRAISAYDVLAMPTVPMVAPAIGTLEADNDLFVKTNLTLLRNPALINMLDGCAISLPAHAEGEAPVGLMLAAAGGRDAALLANARAVEAALRR